MSRTLQNSKHHESDEGLLLKSLGLLTVNPKFPSGQAEGFYLSEIVKMVYQYEDDERPQKGEKCK